MFSMLSATALLCSTSCSDDAIVSEAGGEALVQFSVELNDGGVASRSLMGDGGNATELYYEVYATSGQGENLTIATTPLSDHDKKVRLENGRANVNLALVKKQTYYVVFWAQSEGAPYVNSDVKEQQLTAINVDTLVSNDYHKDAFTAVREIKVEGAKSETVYLTRPFAQVNFGTTKADFKAALAAGMQISTSKVEASEVSATFNALTQTASQEVFVTKFEGGNVLTTGIKVEETEEGEKVEKFVGESLSVANEEYAYLGTAYVFVPGDQATADLTMEIETGLNDAITVTVPYAPIRRNYRTNVLGNLLTNQTDFTVVVDANFNADDKYGAIDGEVYYKVDNATEFADAFSKGVDVIILNENVNLNELQARSVGDPTYTIASGKTLTIDLNGKKLSATSNVSSGNREMFLVKGTLNVKNGTIEYEHKGENMGWNAMTTIFDVTAGGVLNLEGVTAKNLGGSDMGFVAHLNNWGEVTLNAENCTLESNYVPVRVFNSGYDMNNVDIKNSTLNGGSYAFWVHNYTAADFGSEAKAESQKALLNLNIYNQGNTFSPDVNGIRYGMTNKITTDAYGITKSVSEDGTEVTLGSVVENGVIRRGVAGTEENTTIKKVVVEEGVSVLYDRTFRRFYALEEVVLPAGLTTIGASGSGVFQSCTNLKTIVIPESVTVLGKGSFQECSSLESINIPAGVTRIESDALRATGLKEVEFHAGVTYFGTQAFRDCKQLTKVVINAPEFTMEGNTFGIMAAPFTPMTIEVANAEMKAYVESMLTAHAKTYITVVAPEQVDNAAALQEALEEGKNVVFVSDITAPLAYKAIYGTPVAVQQKNGGVINGNEYSLDIEKPEYNGYAIETYGGTIKNLTIDTAVGRGIIISSPKEDVYIENCVVDGPGYAINTTEHNGKNLYVTNSTVNGWTSLAGLESVVFTKCNLGENSSKYWQSMGYEQDYDRLIRPYVNMVFDACKFTQGYYVDLSALGASCTVTFKACLCDGNVVTVDNYSNYITIELPAGRTLADCVVFE